MTVGAPTTATPEVATEPAPGAAPAPAPITEAEGGAKPQFDFSQLGISPAEIGASSANLDAAAEIRSQMRGDTLVRQLKQELETYEFNSYMAMMKKMGQSGMQ